MIFQIPQDLALLAQHNVTPVDAERNKLGILNKFTVFQLATYLLPESNIETITALGNLCGRSVVAVVEVVGSIPGEGAVDFGEVAAFKPLILPLVVSFLQLRVVAKRIP